MGVCSRHVIRSIGFPPTSIRVVVIVNKNAPSHTPTTKKAGKRKTTKCVIIYRMQDVCLRTNPSPSVMEEGKKRVTSFTTIDRTDHIAHRGLHSFHETLNTIIADEDATPTLECYLIKQRSIHWVHTFGNDTSSTFA